MKSFLTVLALLAAAGSASAIVVSNYSVAVSSPTNEVSGDWDLNWDYVYYYKTMSSVAIGSHWLLTAAHVALEMTNRSSTVVIDGVKYYEQAVYLHDPADDPDHSGIADLALVRFDKPFPDYYPLYTGTFPEKVWKNGSWQDNRLPCVIVGYGNTGTVSITTYTVAGSGSGVKRWGSNKIDGTHTNVAYSFWNYRVDPKVLVSTVNDGLQILFTQSETAYEAGTAVFDSGSGTFVEEGGIWKLAGINTTRYGTDPNYTGTFAVSVPSYATWITQTIAAADGDDDSDGIPNWWEEQHSTNILALIDQDGDGAIGADEYTADTNPTNPASFFEMSSFSVSTNQKVTFNGSTARKYQLFYTSRS